MKCMKCGWPVPEDSVFCQYCGEKIEAEQEGRLETLTEADANARQESPVLDIPEPVGAALQEESVAAETSTEDTPESEALVENALEGETPAVEQELTPVVEHAALPSPGKSPAQVNAREGKKQRYCKRCGSPVDRKTKKCQGCGKQYFRLRRLGVGLLAVLCLTLVGLNVFQYTQIISTQKRLEQVNKALSAQTKTISSLKSDVATYRDRWRKDSSKAAFMDDYIVIIGESNNRYHKYGCEDLDTSHFYAYNTESAKAQGYRACKKCIP